MLDLNVRWLGAARVVHFLLSRWSMVEDRLCAIVCVVALRVCELLHVVVCVQRCERDVQSDLNVRTAG